MRDDQRMRDEEMHPLPSLPLPDHPPPCPHLLWRRRRGGGGGGGRGEGGEVERAEKGKGEKILNFNRIEGCGTAMLGTLQKWLDWRGGWISEKPHDITAIL